VWANAGPDFGALCRYACLPMRRSWLALALALGFTGLVLSAALPSQSAPPRRAAPRAAKKPDKGRPPAKPSEEKASDETQEGVADRSRVVGAEPTTQVGPKVLDVKEQGDGGVKTYKFGPQEVEGRLKSPQIVYFLRRVRAEFAAGELGHRSFMRELSDTRRNPALK
jgi:hypothetical protein